MKPRIYSCIVLALGLILNSCGGDDEISQEAQLEVDIQKINNYITTQGLQNVQSTESGLHYIVTKEGTGNFHSDNNNVVVVNYEGRLLNGDKFDSSIDRGTPFTFTLGVGQVIGGWDEGIALFSEESEFTLIIPSSLAYGTRGTGSIGANEVLVFDIKIFSDNELLARDVESIEAYIESISLTGVQTTDSELRYVITEPGSGDLIKFGDEVSVSYIGYFLGGGIFARTLPEQTFDFTVGLDDVIDGWDESMSFLKPGAEGTFLLPSKIAYGRVGALNEFGEQIIFPNEPIIYEISVVSVNE